MTRFGLLLLVALAGCGWADAADDELLFGSPAGSGVVTVPFDTTQDPGCMSWDGTEIQTHASNPNCDGGGGTPAPTVTPFACGTGYAVQDVGATPGCVLLPTPDGGSIEPTATPWSCGAGNGARGMGGTPECFVVPTPDGAAGGATPGAGTPQPIATSTSAPGTADGFARSDHVHHIPDGAIGPAKFAATVPTPLPTATSVAFTNQAQTFTGGQQFNDDVFIASSGSFTIDGSGLFGPNFFLQDDNGNSVITFDPFGAGTLAASGTGVLRANDVACTTCVALGTEVSGTLPLANGGTGAALTDPNADRLVFWDDSAGTTDWLTVSTGLSVQGTAIVAVTPVYYVTPTPYPTWTPGPTPTAYPFTVQEGDTTVESAAVTLDFNATSFDITSSPSGEANVALSSAVSQLGSTIEGTELNTTFTVPSGTTVDFGATTNKAPLDLPRDTAANCNSVTSEGRFCWGTDDDVLGVGTGSAHKRILMLSGDQTAAGIKRFSDFVQIGIAAPAVTPTPTPTVTPTVTGATATPAFTPWTTLTPTPTSTAATPTPTPSPPITYAGKDGRPRHIFTFSDTSIGLNSTRYFSPNSSFSGVSSDEPTTSILTAEVMILQDMDCGWLTCQAIPTGSQTIAEQEGFKFTLCKNASCTDTAVFCETKFHSLGTSERAEGYDDVGTISFTRGDRMSLEAAKRTNSTAGIVAVAGSWICVDRF